MARTDLTEDGVAARLKSDRATAVARRLRKDATPAEKRLWLALRRLRLDGTHFRRQTPIGPYICDFCCLKARLIIELDGGAHLAPDVALRDVERQKWLEGRGFRVLRFVNAEVLRDAEGVARAIGREARGLMLMRDAQSH
jgi:very-short-patch-repair endonuclease